ncbi:MAG: TRAP transporter large permease subunit [Proteobacteria bacterium]|nr:TRAP transporter large permease subunit [Pseudomonadota bacterium]
MTTPSSSNKWLTFITTISLTLLLVGVVLFSTIGNIHSKLLDVAESTWTGYSELRQPPVVPDCSLTPEDAPAQTEARADSDDFLDDLFGEEEASISDEAIVAAAAICVERHAKFEHIVQQRQGRGLSMFVGFERFVGKIALESVNLGRHILILILMFCGIATTISRMHLSLRNPKTRFGDRLSQAAQLGGNLIIVASFAALYRQELSAGLEIVSDLPLYWMASFLAMAVCNVLLLMRPLSGTDRTPFSQLLLGIPLHTYMTWTCGIYFFVIERHFSGIGIYLDQMTEHANLYTNVALYVFSGMILKHTRIADKFLAIIRPWKLSPELLVFIIVIASAFPTAYSGASGIFVIAAGAILYREFKRANVRDTLALAGSAMSGSMGIVLSPCLLVVVIAALNKDVTTTELFSAGLSVFFVNIVVLAIVLFATRHAPIRCENPIIAMPQMGRACLPILPYVAIAAAVVLVFRYGLGAGFDEFSAPYLLPFILLMLLIFDRLSAKKEWTRDESSKSEPAPKPDGIIDSLFNAAKSTSVYSGGLLTLMTLSICFGGILDRANFSQFLPQTYATPFMAMLVLVIILVLVGMVMDPYGAVILVSATLTQIAYTNGISPIHFWIVVLCAFELGYLTPPVSLNQILTRRVVGEEAYAYEDAPDRPKKFWDRYERSLLPIAFKGSVLILVAFIPLLINVMR